MASYSCVNDETRYLLFKFSSWKNPFGRKMKTKLLCFTSRLHSFLEQYDQPVRIWVLLLPFPSHLHRGD